MPPRRRPGASERPLAVVDVGSNSVRLVVFRSARRSAAVLYNEKVTCELGRGLHRDGRLAPENVARALDAIARFVALARSFGSDIRVFGTAAVRDAANGAEFAAALGRRVNLPVTVLSGAEEARLSARGVVSGIPDASGLVGDLGGGSLELVAVAGGRIGRHATFPIGPLRLIDVHESAVAASTRAAVNAHLAGQPWLGGVGGDFYAVGGAWRALARLHMAQIDYPLRVLHHYRLAADDADELCGLVARMGRQSLRRVAAVSRNRLDALPWAALVLQRIIRTAAPKSIVFSANGLREGVLFESLGAAERRRDPLIAACTDAARGRDRFGDHAQALYRFSAGAVPDDDARTDRLRRAAALLSDVAWREHPEHRAEFAIETALYLPYGCLSHDERAWLALALHARYGGAEDAPGAAVPRRLLAAESARKARATGLGFRLGYALGGAVPATLRHAELARQGNRLELRAGPRLAPLLGELIDRRLRILAEALGLTPVVVPAKARPLAAATR